MELDRAATAVVSGADDMKTTKMTLAKYHRKDV